MYNFFAVAGFTAMLTTTAPMVASDPTTLVYSPAVVAHATALTRAMAQRIHFNEGQYVQVKALHLRMLAERRNLEIGLAAATPADRDSGMATAQSRYEAELAQLLQPTQLVAYQQLRRSFTAHRL